MSVTIQSQPSSDTTNQAANMVAPPTTATPGSQLPGSTLSQLQQEVDTTSTSPTNHSGIWMGIIIGASIVFVIAAAIVSTGFIARKRKATAS